MTPSGSAGTSSTIGTDARSDDRWRVTRAALSAMIREEWRLHSSLFGGSRFAVFPVFVAVVVAASTLLLGTVGVTGPSVVFGVFALVFVFGLHTGTIGLVGRDAMGDLLGDVTLVLFTARTLPLSPRRLVGVFIVKDVLYYAGLFMVPISVGLAPAVAGAGPLPTAGTVALVWLALTATFVVGLLTTIALLGLNDHGVSGRAAILAVVAVLLGLWWYGVDVWRYTPYGIYAHLDATSVVSSVVLLFGVGLVATLSFDVTRTGAGRSSRSVDPFYGRLLDRFGDPVATKTLLDVHRSSGSVLKVVFSGVILLAVTAALVVFVQRITLLRPSAAVSFGAVLGFSGFTSYNWVTQFDDVEEYVLLPLSVREVLAGKYRAFLFIGPPTAVVFYLVATLWWGASLPALVVGAVLVVGVTAYTGGLTMYLAGFSPNEFLFDTTKFGLFWIGIAVPVIPLLVVGFMLAPLSLAALGGVGLWGVVLGAAGVGLLSASRGKWDAYYRSV